MDKRTRDHIEDLRYNELRRLEKLQTKAAKLGLATPPEIEIEIEDIGIKLETLNQDLQQGRIGSTDQGEEALDDVKKRIDGVDKRIKEQITDITIQIPILGLYIRIIRRVTIATLIALVLSLLLTVEV